MDNLHLDNDEARELAELGEVFATTHSAGWTRINSLIAELAEEAHEDMVGATDSLEARGLLQLRWQQRESMKRAIENYVGHCESRRAEILKEISRRDEEREREQLVSQIQEGA